MRDLRTACALHVAWTTATEALSTMASTVDKRSINVLQKYVFPCHKINFTRCFKIFDSETPFDSAQLGASFFGMLSACHKWRDIRYLQSAPSGKAPSNYISLYGETRAPFRDFGGSFMLSFKSSKSIHNQIGMIQQPVISHPLCKAYPSQFLEAKRILNSLISACGDQVIKLYSP